MSSNLPIRVFVTILVVFSVSLLGAQTPSAPNWESGLETALKDLPMMRQAFDSLVEKLTGETIRIRDVRSSPLSRGEQSSEIPMEFTIIMTEKDIVPVLKAFASIRNDECRIVVKSMFIAASAESTAKREPLLAVVIHSRIIDGAGFPGELRERRNQRFVRALEDLSMTTTFTPQVRRKILFPGPGGDPPKAVRQILEGSQGHWLTSFRIDPDDRVMFAGYTVEGQKDPAALREAFSNVSSFCELSPLTGDSSVYEKIPVRRFEWTARIREE